MKDLEIRSLDSAFPGFDDDLDALLTRTGESDAGVDEVVAGILGEVRRRGDEALIEFTREYDRVEVESPADLRLDRGGLDECLERLDADLHRALQTAATRIRDYHQRQLEKSWEYEEEDGTESW